MREFVMWMNHKTSYEVTKESKAKANEETVPMQLVLAGLLSLRRVNANLLVVLLERRQILAGLRELSLLHALTDIPVDEGTLRVQEIELVVEATPCGRDGGRVREHAQATCNLREVTTRDMRRGLVADSELEAGRAPVNELDGPLRLDETDSGVRVLGDDITTVEERAGHWNWPLT